MSSNSSNIMINITEAIQIAVSQATAKSKEWYVPNEQVSTVASALWIIAAAGFVLNTVLLFRYLRSKWYLLPLPSPSILVNLCLSNLLLVLGVFLAALSLSFDIGESSVKAGEAELFFTIGVLIQSWLGQIMVLFCGRWARKSQYQTKVPCSEIPPPAITNKMGKQGRAKAVTYRSMSRQHLYQPCRRHSRLTQTFKDRQSSTEVSVNRPREAFAAASSPLSMTMKQKQTVRWLLTWSWLLCLLAATAVLMTTADSRDACLTLIPFQKTYMIPGGDVSMIKVIENGVMRIPFLLVLVPVYIVGLGGAVWSALTSWSKKHLNRTTEGRKAVDRILTKPLPRLRILNRTKRHKHSHEKEVQFKSHGSQSTCSIYMNAAECLCYPGEKTLEGEGSGKPNSYEDEQRGIYPEKDRLTQESRQNAICPRVLSASSSHRQHVDQYKLTYSKAENISFGDYCCLEVTLEEKQAAVLPVLDNSTDTAKVDRKPRDAQDFTSTEKRTQEVCIDQTFDLSVTHSTNAELNCLTAAENNDTTFPHDASTLQAANAQKTFHRNKISHERFYKAQTAQKDRGETDSASENNESIMEEDSKKNSLTLSASRQITKTARGNRETLSYQNRNTNEPLPKRSMSRESTLSKAVINQNNSANDQFPPMTNGPQDKMTSGQAGSRLAMDRGRPREMDTESLSSRGDSTSIASRDDHCLWVTLSCIPLAG